MPLRLLRNVRVTYLLTDKLIFSNCINLKMMKKIVLIFVLIFVTIAGYSQQDAQYTNYMYNTITINPAYAGSRNVLSVFGLHRNQWSGLEGAPVTNNFAINTPFTN